MSVTENHHQPPPGAPPSPRRADERDILVLARRLVPLALLGSVLLVTVRLTAAPLDNTDTYFHLRFGEEFLHHWSLRHPGSVSTFATQHWLPTQWLPEELMAFFDDRFGLAGVAWLAGLWQIALVAALYLLARRRADPLLSVLALLPVLAAVSLGLSARPQVLSYVFVAVVLMAWLKSQEDLRPRWWQIPLTWLWAMCHGMWPVGIGLGVVFVVGIALDQGIDLRRSARLALVPLGSAVAAALTPVGPGLYGAVLSVGDRSRFFSEWQAPDYTKVPACMALGVCLAVTLVLLLRVPSRPPWTDILLVLSAGACAVQSYRTVPIAAIIVLPILAGAAQSAVRSERRPLGRLETRFVAGSSVAALVLLAVMVPQTSDEPLAEPAWVDPSLSALPAGTKVVSDWDFGGYLMWRYPHLDPLMHGYGDTFTLPELERNDDIIKLNPGWDTELRATGSTIAVLKSDSALAYALQHQEGWHVEHRSSTLEMLTAPADWAQP